jgi:hypothetical protein
MTRKPRVFETGLGPLVLLGPVAISLFSAACQGPGGSPPGPGSPTPCAITVKAFAQPDSNGFMAVSGVAVAGTLYSVVGASTCSGTLTSFSGLTEPITGAFTQTGTQMNANWTVEWNWIDTAFYACPPNPETEYVPDGGAVFLDDCQL